MLLLISVLFRGGFVAGDKPGDMESAKRASVGKLTDMRQHILQPTHLQRILMETHSELNTCNIDPARVNSKRYDAYHPLDLWLDSRGHYTNYNLVLFFSVLNTYNRASIFTYYWDNEDREVDRIDQWKLLPIGGLELEF